MIPFYVLLAAVVLARAVGLAWAPLGDWPTATRVGLAVMFVFTGFAHFTATRRDLIAMVPPMFPAPGMLVTLTGLAEFAGAVGLLVPPAQRWAAAGLIVLLIAMFPANIYAAKIDHRIAGRRHTRMALRLPLQILWIGLLWWSAIQYS